MALINEWEKTGNWLFVRRSWLPLFFIIAGILVMFFDGNDISHVLIYEMICLAVSLLGELIRIITVGHAPKNTSGRNTKSGQVADCINTTGIYSLIRHPLYVGNFFMWLGPVLFIRSFWFTIVFFLAYWLYYERIMFAEEQFLRRKFGEAYDKWSEKVKAVIPHSLKVTKTDLPFSLKTVLRREYNSIFNVFLIFLSLDIVRNFIIDKKIAPTPIWLWLFLGGLLFWITIRILYKKTSIFHVEGR